MLHPLPAQFSVQLEAAKALNFPRVDQQAEEEQRARQIVRFAGSGWQGRGGGREERLVFFMFAFLCVCVVVMVVVCVRVCVCVWGGGGIEGMERATSGARLLVVPQCVERSRLPGGVRRASQPVQPSNVASHVS